MTIIISIILGIIHARKNAEFYLLHISGTVDIWCNRRDSNTPCCSFTTPSPVSHLRTLKNTITTAYGTSLRIDTVAQNGETIDSTQSYNMEEKVEIKARFYIKGPSTICLYVF